MRGLLSVAEDDAKALIKSLVVYPRTTSLQKDKPLVVFEFRPTPGEPFPPKKIEEFVLQNDVLKGLGVEKDIAALLIVMAWHRDAILLDEADCVQFHKDQVDVLRIVNLNKMANESRSIVIEINAARKSVVELVQETSRWRRRSYWIVGVILTVIFSLLICRE